MDAGLAAICGALAGSAATIGAALATGWSQREGARILARAEHEKQRREPRNETYKELIAAIEELRNSCFEFRATSEGPAPMRLSLLSADKVTECRSAAERVRKAWLDVQLAGPMEVSTQATRIQDAASFISGVTLGLSVATELESRGEEIPARDSVETLWNSLSIRAKTLTPLLGDFTRVAQSALDRNGADG